METPATFDTLEHELAKDGIGTLTASNGNVIVYASPAEVDEVRARMEKIGIIVPIEIVD